MTLSLLDWRFVAALALWGLLRGICPQKYYLVVSAALSALLIGFCSPVTLAVLGTITLFWVFPINRTGRMIRWGIIGLVALLVFYKLDRQFTWMWPQTEWLHVKIAGIVGFSYFTFRVMGFLHIQSILNAKERSFAMVFYYALFPPTLTSGPIQKFPDFKKEVEAPRKLSSQTLSEAVYRITRGYFRKVVLAVSLDSIVRHLLSSAEMNFFAVVATIAVLYLFFYFDFAGYSDVAIGFGLLLGIRVPENFRKPFTATTVAEFWRNWHITLADWFRDQVFIPLGGMRASRFRAAFIAFGIMVLCGLWHGLTWNFVAWGLWHGSILAAEGLSGVKPIPPANRTGVKYWLRILWTNGRVAFGAVFFLPAEAIQKLFYGFVNLGF